MRWTLADRGVDARQRAEVSPGFGHGSARHSLPEAKKAADQLRVTQLLTDVAPPTRTQAHATATVRDGEQGGPLCGDHQTRMLYWTVADWDPTMTITLAPRSRGSKQDTASPSVGPDHPITNSHELPVRSVFSGAAQAPELCTWAPAVPAIPPFGSLEVVAVHINPHALAAARDNACATVSPTASGAPQ